MPKEYSRMERIDEQCRRALAGIIQHSVSDPRLGLISVTKVDVSKDLRNAKVYITCLEGDERAKDSIAALTESAGYIRGQLAKEVRMRNIPALKFYYDDTIAYGSHLSQLMNDVED